eukprot:7122974-Prymnesium_polylepis.1
MYALNIYCASLGNMQNSSRKSLLISFCVSLAFVFYQIPYAWYREHNRWIVSHFSEVAPSLILDAKTPGIEDDDAPSGLQLLTFACWSLIALIYLCNLVAELFCGKDFWRRYHHYTGFLPLRLQKM